MSIMLSEKLANIYPEFRKERSVKPRKWFFDSGMKQLVNAMMNVNLMSPEESLEVKSIVFDTLQASAWKIDAVQSLLKEWLSKDFVEAFIPIIIGSVGRFEAEPGSDIDMKFLVDTSLIARAAAERQAKDLLVTLNSALKEKAPKGIVTFRLREAEVAFCTLEELCDPDRGIVHFTDLIMGCHVLSNKDKLDKAMSQLMVKIDKEKVLNEMVGRLETNLTRRYADPVTVGYMIVTYAIRMLALNYLSYDDLNKCYWRICEILYERIDGSFWMDIATMVRTLIYARRRQDRREELRNFIKHQIMSMANSIYMNTMRLTRAQSAVRSDMSTRVRISLEEFEKTKGEINQRLQVMDQIVEALKQEERIRKEYKAPRPYNIDTLPPPFSRRVFVGGSYRDVPTLKQIALYLSERGYIPIIGLDFDRPDGMNIRELDLLLLHNCKYAVFELSIPAGQYSEVEAAFIYGVKTYGLCKSGDPEARKQISTMITDLFDRKGEEIFYYSDFEQLRKVIRNLFAEDC